MKSAAGVLVWLDLAQSKSHDVERHSWQDAKRSTTPTRYSLTPLYWQDAVLLSCRQLRYACHCNQQLQSNKNFMLLRYTSMIGGASTSISPMPWSSSSSSLSISPSTYMTQYNTMVADRQGRMTPPGNGNNSVLYSRSLLARRHIHGFCRVLWLTNHPLLAMWVETGPLS